MVVPTRILSLCTGLGGLDLGVEIAAPGARTICIVERDAYCASLLAQSMEQGHIPQAPIWDDLRTFDGRPWRGSVDCVTAGYPCQPFSCAGQKRGADDARHLWPEVFRVIGECRAPLVFLENVARHLTAGFDVVARDLQSLGYTVAAMVCRAATVGAPHQRERLFALAVSDASRERIGELAEWIEQHAPECWNAEPIDLGEVLANGNGTRCESKRWTANQFSRQAQWNDVDGCNLPSWPPGPTDLERWSTISVEFWPSVESPVCGVAYGLPGGLGFRREQLHALGNAVVPIQAAYAFATLVKAVANFME